MQKSRSSSARKLAMTFLTSAALVQKPGKGRGKVSENMKERKGIAGIFVKKTRIVGPCSIFQASEFSRCWKEDFDEVENN